ncbi:hypothetical protein FE784_39955 [Paenibacillus hemerocallicola]|uniref:SsfX3-like N-terminal domain-containing protein n=1 Tax=Paenibacillus hemerocallicola TaxID=1172614 RepID=A0A5C4SVQ8_9BACL|nr:hypothetical protein FE784_39955 [Paenibacillus hemerocallicola]
MEQTDSGIKPWRIPYKEYSLFPPSGINNRAHHSAGVRLVFESDTTAVTIEVEPLEFSVQFDLVCGETLIVTSHLEPGESLITFAGRIDHF